MTKHVAIVTENGETKRYPIDMERDALAELEAWNDEHKRRHVDISRDDGYGATYWEVTLHGVGTRTVRAIDWGPTDTTKHVGVVYACVEDPDDPDDADGPGLKATILAAIDHARRLEPATADAFGLFHDCVHRDPGRARPAPTMRSKARRLRGEAVRWLAGLARGFEGARAAFIQRYLRRRLSVMLEREREEAALRRGLLAWKARRGGLR